MEVGVKRAGFGCIHRRTTPATGKCLRAHWLMARTMEVMGGWEHRPLPLADSGWHAAAAIGQGCPPGAELEPRLRIIDDELHRSCVVMCGRPISKAHARAVRIRAVHAATSDSDGCTERIARPELARAPHA